MVLLHHARFAADAIETLLQREGFEKYLIALVGSVARGEKTPNDIDLLVYIPDARPSEVVDVSSKLARLSRQSYFARVRYFETKVRYFARYFDSSIVRYFSRWRATRTPIDIIVVNDRLFRGIKHRGVDPLETFVAATMAKDAEILVARNVTKLPEVVVDEHEAREFLETLETLKLPKRFVAKYTRLTFEALREREPNNVRV